MSKFKVGDRVRILNSNSSDFQVGSEHVIDAVLCDHYKVADFYFDDEHLELVESKSKFKVGHGAICIRDAVSFKVGDVVLIDKVLDSDGFRPCGMKTYVCNEYFIPCPNPPRAHYKERIAYALGADIETEHTKGCWRRIASPVFYDANNYRVAIPDIHAEKREKLQSEIARLQSELDNLGGDL